MNNAHRIQLLGHTDQGGRPDGVQVMVARDHAYVGHMFSDGITVIDVADPRAPRPVRFIACPPNTRASHIQVHDGERSSGLPELFGTRQARRLGQWDRGSPRR